MNLDWPFFDTRHRQLGRDLDAWAKANLTPSHGDDVEAEVRALVAKLGHAGYLGLTIADGALDVRSLAIARATLAYHSGLADFAFAMQGLARGRSACSAPPASAPNISARSPPASRSPPSP
ncbi:MAG TPA: hypothetical protein VGR05_04310 [Sphingomicrobium sp.]|nr:hypothetical protein [Sphingomicrobium sp.]